MNCNCEKAPEFPTKAFIPGPIEIPINFRAVTIPADQGDDTTNPPLNGAYRNVVLQYAANNHTYIYSSDGIPVMLVGGINFDDIANRPKYDGQPMTSDTDIPDLTDEVETLEEQIQALATDFSYKGSVEDYDHLPSDAATGDVYTTLDTGLIYVWDGSQWVALNKYPDVFVGTDGTNPGTEGLVPAPTAADAGKVLSADGGWVDNESFYDVKIQSLRTDKTYNEIKNAWESGKIVRFSGLYNNLFWFDAKPKGSNNSYPIPVYGNNRYIYTLNGDVDYNATGTPSIVYLKLTKQSSGDWQNLPLSANTEPVVNLRPSDLSTTVPDYKVPSITVLKNALAEKEPVTIVNAGAPTTSTTAVSVGQQYYDSTNNKLYYCSAITAQGTDPETYEYTWSSFGPNVVQTTGTSTTDVMSQNATTSMIFADPSTAMRIRIGSGSNAGTDSVGIGKNASGYMSGCVAIGRNADAHNQYTMAIGAQSSATNQGAIALGAYSSASHDGEMNIGSSSTTYGYNNTNYRLLSGVYDPQNAHDAATKGYVDARGITFLSTADYDTPSGNPTSIDLKNLAPGIYRATEDLNVYQPSGIVIPANSTLWILAKNGAPGGYGAYAIYEAYGQELRFIFNNVDFGWFLTSYNVKNNLTTTTAGSPLDAVQGRALNNKIENRVKSGSGTPTSSTEGGAGTIYENVVDGKLYVCTGATPQGTTPETYIYTWEEISTASGAGLTTLSYGNSTWNDFLTAYNAGKIVYCRASSSVNPGVGDQTRMAFMAYVNNPTTPTEVEFQYVRSVSSKTAAQPCDQVFVYKLTSASGGTWTVESRNVTYKVAAGTNVTTSYSNGTVTINADAPVITMTDTDPGEGGALAANNFIAVYNAS